MKDLNWVLYGDDAPIVDIGLITLIPEDERDAFRASLLATPDEDDEQ